MIKVDKTAKGCTITNCHSMVGLADVWDLSFDEIRELIQSLLWAYGFPERKEKK